MLLPSSGSPRRRPRRTPPADFEQRLLHVTQLTASAQGSPTVGTTHLLAALLDDRGTDAASAAEVARVLTESGVDVDGLRRSRSFGCPGERQKESETGRAGGAVAVHREAVGAGSVHRGAYGCGACGCGCVSGGRGGGGRREGEVSTAVMAVMAARRPPTRTPRAQWLRGRA